MGDEIAPSMEEMNKLLVEKVVVKTLEEITLKNGRPAVSLYGAHTHLHMNPSGKFIIGGPQGDAGLTAARASFPAIRCKCSVAFGLGRIGGHDGDRAELGQGGCARAKVLWRASHCKTRCGIRVPRSLSSAVACETPT